MMLPAALEPFLRVENLHTFTSPEFSFQTGKHSIALQFNLRHQFLNYKFGWEFAFDAF